MAFFFILLGSYLTFLILDKKVEGEAGTASYAQFNKINRIQ